PGRADQRYGWSRPDDGPVTGAFLQAPGHPPVLSIMDVETIESLVDVTPAILRVCVDGRLTDLVVAAWGRHGVTLTERSRVRLRRLDRLQAPPPPAGQARVAAEADRELLVSWYDQLMAAYPDDPTDRAYVVDDPLSYGGITLWEVEGAPVAMAGRSRLV